VRCVVDNECSHESGFMFGTPIYAQELLGLIFQPGYWLSWLRLFMIFHSPFIQMLGYCHKIGYNHLAVSRLYCSVSKLPFPREWCS